MEAVPRKPQALAVVVPGGLVGDNAKSRRPRGGPYSKRRLQQIVKELAAVAEIRKRVYPHLLQKFLGHENPQTTQVYYEPSRPQVERAFREVMGRKAGDGIVAWQTCENTGCALGRERRGRRRRASPAE